jgi:hypothetical protein
VKPSQAAACRILDVLMLRELFVQYLTRLRRKRVFFLPSFQFSDNLSVLQRFSIFECVLTFLRTESFRKFETFAE